MIDFRTIETFLWVATLRSFRGAAEKLNTTQPAVSMRIAQLEDLLGVRLLERDRRSRRADAEGTGAHRLCGAADAAARRDDRGGRRPFHHARHRAARVLRDHRAHLAAGADRAGQRRLSEPRAGDRGRHHAQPARAAGRRAISISRCCSGRSAIRISTAARCARFRSPSSRGAKDEAAGKAGRARHHREISRS